MSNRSRIIRDQKALAAQPAREVKLFPNMQRHAAEAQPMNLGLEHLVELLMSQGAYRGYKIQTSAEAGVVRLVAQCGPIEIPLDFSVEIARELAQAIKGAADSIESRPESDELPPLSPAAQDLLDEACAVVQGTRSQPPRCPRCERDLAGCELSTVNGQFMSSSFYCFGCELTIDLSDGVLA